jgi:hypothetical protein
VFRPSAHAVDGRRTGIRSRGNLYAQDAAWALKTAPIDTRVSMLYLASNSVTV